jgi:hypothetical protein
LTERERLAAALDARAAALERTAADLRSSADKLQGEAADLRAAIVLLADARAAVIEDGEPPAAADAGDSEEETPPSLTARGSVSRRAEALLLSWRRWATCADICEALEESDHKAVSSVLSWMEKRGKIARRPIPDHVIPHDGRARYQFAHPSVLSDRARTALRAAV